jgi:hypothetical protein
MGLRNAGTVLTVVLAVDAATDRETAVPAGIGRAVLIEFEFLVVIYFVDCSGLSVPRPRVSATTAPRCPIGCAGPTVLSMAV